MSLGIFHDLYLFPCCWWGGWACRCQRGLPDVTAWLRWERIRRFGSVHTSQPFLRAHYLWQMLLRMKDSKRVKIKFPWIEHFRCHPLSSCGRLAGGRSMRLALRPQLLLGGSWLSLAGSSSLATLSPSPTDVHFVLRLVYILPYLQDSFLWK